MYFGTTAAYNNNQPEKQELVTLIDKYIIKKPKHRPDEDDRRLKVLCNQYGDYVLDNVKTIFGTDKVSELEDYACFLNNIHHNWRVIVGGKQKKGGNLKLFGGKKIKNNMSNNFFKKKFKNMSKKLKIKFKGKQKTIKFKNSRL